MEAALATALVAFAGGIIAALIKNKEASAGLWLKMLLLVCSVGLVCTLVLIFILAVQNMDFGIDFGGFRY